MKSHKRTKEWFDNDDFWRETYPFMFPERRFAIAAETVKKALKLTRIRGKAALDLCCGPGRCSVALAKRGFSVTGVDRTKFLLDKARGRARIVHADVEWIQSDMRDFVRPEAFDLAISMFTSFGYFDNRSDEALVLANIFKSLRPGGALLMDLMGKEILAKSFIPTLAETLPDGSILIEQAEILDDWDRIRNKWTVIRNGRARHFTLQLNLYSGQQLRETLEHAGFSEVKLYGNIDGAAYNHDAKRLVAVGRKRKG